MIIIIIILCGCLIAEKTQRSDTFHQTALIVRFKWMWGFWVPFNYLHFKNFLAKGKSQPFLPSRTLTLLSIVGWVSKALQFFESVILHHRKSLQFDSFLHNIEILRRWEWKELTCIATIHSFNWKLISSLNNVRECFTSKVTGNFN